MTAPTLITGLSRIEQRLFSGFVLDPMEPERRFVVEALLDGRSVFWRARTAMTAFSPSAGKGTGGTPSSSS